MKEAFIEKRFGAERQATIARANQIVEAYQAQGLRLTLRQLYYQFVTRNWLPNTERSYKNLGEALSEARLAGLVDWDAIEDRVRVPKVPTEFADLAELARAALASYRLPRWVGQDAYVELWVEKDALAGVFAPIAREYHVTLMVNRGYSSQSAMYEAAERYKAHAHQDAVLLYLGDHDPSGEDMVRDVRDRLVLFGCDVKVEKLALTMDQVREHNPPPNPAKKTDSRAAAYIAEHGASSWEVDALPPEVLTRLIRAAIQRWVDPGRMDEVKAQEKLDKKELTRAVQAILDGRKEASA